MSKYAERLTETPRALLRWVLMKVLFALSDHSTIDGIEVIDVAGEESNHTLVRLREVLEVIRGTDRRRYERLKRDLPRIVLIKAGGPEFASEVGACLLRSRYVRESDSASVATTLVHEATHARLCGRGIGYGRAIRARVERVCVKQQVDFVERLARPDIMAHLRTKLDNPWWEPDQLRERRSAGLRELGVPRWLRSWLGGADRTS